MAFFKRKTPAELIEDDLWEALGYWHWGAKEYAVHLMSKVVDKVVKEEPEVGKETETEASAYPGTRINEDRIESEIDYDEYLGADQSGSLAWREWKFG